MQARLSANVHKPMLVREVRGIVREIILHPNEKPVARRGAHRAPIFLIYMPLAVVVELDNPSLASVTFAPGMPPGHVLTTPQGATWTWRRYLPIDGAVSGGRKRKEVREMRRRQLPLAPALVNTHYGLQGQTARTGIVAYLLANADLEVPPGKQPTPA
jgi:hypothetical protein